MNKNNLIKFSIISVALTLTGSVIASTLPGPYVGAQIGLSKARYDRGGFDLTNNQTTAGSVDSKGLAGRFYIGYQFNQNVSAEFGYFELSKVKAKNLQYQTAQSFTTAEIKQHAYDLSAKIMFPIQQDWAVYLRAGAARITADGNRSNMKTDETKNTPEFGLGFDYTITPNVDADVSWTRINHRDDISSVDFYALGLSYHFAGV